MRNKNIARILRGDGGNPRSEQRRNAQAHIIYYMCPLFVFYTNFRNGDARCKGPSLFPKTTPENDGEANMPKHNANFHCALQRAKPFSKGDTQKQRWSKQRWEHFAKRHWQVAAYALWRPAWPSPHQRPSVIDEVNYWFKHTSPAMSIWTTLTRNAMR